MLVDEATANIDVTTESIIYKAMNEAFKNSTVITIAHRLNTVINSDRILVLEGGLLKEYDNPQELLKNPNSFCDEASRKCKCLEGFYSPSGLGGACKAKDYCKEGLDNCASKAKCIPLEGETDAGFFSCECNKGYIT